MKIHFNHLLLIWAASGVAIAPLVSAADITSELIADGDWSREANWNPSTFYPNNGNGGFSFNAALPSRQVTLSEDITLEKLEFTYRPHFGGSTLNLGGFNLHADEISSPIAGVVSGSGTITAATQLTVANDFYLSGATLRNVGAGTMEAGSHLIIQSGGVFENSGILNMRGWLDSPFGNPGTFNNSGVVEFSGRFGQSLDLEVNNTGIIRGVGAPGSDLPIYANFNNEAGALLESDHVDMELLGPFINNGGIFHLKGGRLDSYAGSSFTHNAGEIVLEDDAILSLAGIPGAELFLPDGALRGTGDVIAHVTSDALIAPGNSAGTLVIDYGLTLQDSSEIEMELGGLAQGTEYDFLRIGYGGALLDGVLDLSFINGFASAVAYTDQFTILQVEDFISGGFDNALSGGRVFTSDGLGSFRIDYGVGDYDARRRVVLSDFQAARTVPDSPLGWLPALILGAAVASARLRRFTNQ